MRKSRFLFGALVASSILLSGCSSEDEAASSSQPAKDTVVEAPTEKKAVTEKRDIPQLEKEAAPEPGTHSVTFKDPGKTDLKSYRALDSANEFIAIFVGMADWKIDPVETSFLNRYREEGLIKDLSQLSYDYRNENNVFTKEENKELIAAAYGKIKEDNKDSSLVKLTIDKGVSVNGSLLLKPYDMESKTFVADFPGFNVDDEVNKYFSFIIGTKFGIVNAGEFLDYKVEDLNEAKSVEALRNQGLDVVVYGYISEVSQRNHGNQEIKITPHQVDVMSRKTGKTLFSRSI